MNDKALYFPFLFFGGGLLFMALLRLIQATLGPGPTTTWTLVVRWISGILAVASVGMMIVGVYFATTGHY